MPPADQGLRAVDPTARGIDLRLIVQLELPAAQRLVQVAFELYALLRHRAHAFGIALHVISASFLGAVHGGVGSRDQGVDARPVARAECDADAGGDVHVDAKGMRSEEHTSELQSQSNLVCRLLLEKKKQT